MGGSHCRSGEEDATAARNEHEAWWHDGVAVTLPRRAGQCLPGLNQGAGDRVLGRGRGR